MARRWTIAAAVTLALAFSLAAHAEEAPAARPATVSEAQEAADQKIVEAALSAFGNNGYTGLRPHLDALKAVLGHAPSSYPRIDRRVSPAIIHADAQESLALLLMFAADAQEGRGGAGAVVRPNTYPDACMLLASNAVENRRAEEALHWLDIGLAIQPGNPMLALEKATALGMMHRSEEAVELLKSVIAHLEEWPTVDRARLYRNLGFAYAELDRFDEAQAALKESIRIEPNNPRARIELEYVARRRAGAPATQQEVILSNPPESVQQPVPKKD